MKWRDIVGMLLIASGIAGVFYGIRVASGAEGNTVVSTTCISVGTVANVAAFRVMRDPKRVTGVRASSSTSAARREQEETLDRDSS